MVARRMTVAAIQMSLVGMGVPCCRRAVSGRSRRGCYDSTPEFGFDGGEEGGVALELFPVGLIPTAGEGGETV
jgi:hypothetical protein